jgi:hypothetical protein
MPLRPMKRGHKYVATIEIRGPVENRRAFGAFRKALGKLARRRGLKAKLKQKKTTR